MLELSIQVLGADFVKIMDLLTREGSNFHQKIWLESFEIRDSSRLIRRGDIEISIFAAQQDVGIIRSRTSLTRWSTNNCADWCDRELLEPSGRRVMANSCFEAQQLDFCGGSTPLYGRLESWISNDSSQKSVRQQKRKLAFFLTYFRNQKLRITP